MEGHHTINFLPGPVYSCVTNASKTKIAVNRSASNPANTDMIGKLARIRRSRFHHEMPGLYVRSAFSRVKDDVDMEARDVDG